MWKMLVAFKFPFLRNKCRIMWQKSVLESTKSFLTEELLFQFKINSSSEWISDHSLGLLPFSVSIPTENFAWKSVSFYIKNQIFFTMDYEY